MNKQKKLFLITIFMITCLTAAITGRYTYGTAAETTEDISAAVPETTAQEEYNPVRTITLSRSVLNITEGKKSVLTATVTYGSLEDRTNESVVWSSKDTSVATVTKKGTVRAVSAGKTYIICSSASGEVKARCKIVVREPYNPVKSITLDKTSIRMNKGDQRTLTPSITYGKKTSYSNEAVSWSSSNNKVASVTNKGVVKGKKKGMAYITVRSNYTNISVKCKVVVQKTKYIAFTFDDGPGIYTDKLLDSLEKYHSYATFFVVGNRVNTYKDELKREYEMGMEIGSHTYSHKNLTSLSKSQIASEISKANSAVKNIIGVKPTLLRPPYGNYNKTVSQKAGVSMIYWSVDTLDWKHRKVKYVCDTILKTAKDSEIVLLHDIHETSVDGFIKALPKLRKQGYELVTVSELYSIKGKKLKNGVMYYGPTHDK